jgi:putative transposase
LTFLSVHATRDFMARLARFIVPGVPHHVTQRGNGRQQTFFCDADYRLYQALLKTHCVAHGVAVWGWVLMPNHVHLILVPATQDAIRAALSKVHRGYSGHIHARERRTGHFWQGRFGCVAMDEAHLMAAIPYVALNPVRARLVARAQEWKWSSVHAHLNPTNGDDLTDTAPVLDRVGDFAALLHAGEDKALSLALRRAESIGRPLGDSAFLASVEAQLGRDPKPGKRGPRLKK